MRYPLDIFLGELVRRAQPQRPEPVRKIVRQPGKQLRFSLREVVRFF